MPMNEMLAEFANANNDQLVQRITELFDSLLDSTDESATESIKSELEKILLERTDALDEN